MHNGYIIVRLDTDPDTQAFYAQTLPEALATRDRLQQQTGHDWRIYVRVGV